MSTGSCHIAIEEIPGGKGNDFGKYIVLMYPFKRSTKLKT